MKLDKYYNESSSGETHHAQESGDDHSHKNSSLGTKLDGLMEKKYIIIAIAIFIIIISIVLRAGLLQYQGLFEPDGFFYYSVIRAEINVGHPINYLGISGFPSHNFIGEAPGLPYLTVVFYDLLHGITGLAALTIMRWMPILFGVLYAILAYFIVQYMSKSKVLGLLAMLFVSISSGNIARTAGTVYRGDSFITLPLLVALLLMLKCYEEKSNNRKYIWAVLSAISLSLGIVIWNGAPFVSVIYMLALVFVIAYGFIMSKKEVLFSSLILTITLLLTYILQNIYVALGYARNGLELVNTGFLVFYVPILLVCGAAYYIIKNLHKSQQLSTAKMRLLAGVVATIVIAIVIVSAFYGAVVNVASPISPISTPIVNTSSVNSSVNASISASIDVTTQELQKPTYSFLWSSFNIQLYLAPLGVLLFLLFAFLIYKNERFIKRDQFNLNVVGFLVLGSYFLITTYLQSSAIRYNALISVPLAIFAAFALYGIAKIFYNLQPKKKLPALLGMIIFLLLVVLMVYEFYPVLFTSFHVVSAAIIFALVVVIAFFAYEVYEFSRLNKVHFDFKMIVVAAVIILLVYNFYNTYFESYTASQADGINPQFLTAMSWLKNNTPSNATVLALWPDGSVVEGWGNRTSYMDSVGGENSTKIYFFSKFLFEGNDDVNYLYSIHKPEYLVARNFWYEELGGIAQEGLVTNASDYGYIIMSGLNSSSNGTAQFFSFSSSGYPYYRSELIIIPNTNGTSKFEAFLGLENSTQLQAIQSVILLNTSNGDYQTINTTAPGQGLNFTLLVSYSGRQITGAYVLGSKLVGSNVFKFTFLCNTQVCPYDNANVTLTSVYQNSDTKIFKINYLNS